jgi:hypothetical protein
MLPSGPARIQVGVCFRHRVLQPTSRYETDYSGWPLPLVIAQAEYRWWPLCRIQFKTSHEAIGEVLPL